MIKTFRGLMGDDTQAHINLHTNDGKTGYRLVKMDVLSSDPMDTGAKGVVKIYTVPQSAVSNLIDFSDSTLIGACYYTSNNTTGSNTVNESIIIDTEIFNQDLTITCGSGGSTQLLNYYIELEQISLDVNESTVATLQSIRSKP